MLTSLHRKTAGPGASVHDFTVQAVLLLLLLAALFPGVFLRGESIAPGDILFTALPWADHAPHGFTRPGNPQAVDPVAAFLPWYALSTEALRRGELPLWNPLCFGGMPLLANYQSAVFYPPRMLHLIFGLAWGTTLLILFKLWWCGMAAYWCGRGLGLCRGAARFLSIAWMLCGYNVTWCNWPLTDVAGWLPVLLLGTEQVLSRRYRKGFLVLVLGGTMALLAGHPETAFALAVPLALYFLLRLVLARPGRHDAFTQTGVCAGAAVLTLGLCAVQLFPFLEYLRNSAHFLDRPGMDSNYAMPFSALVGYWVPRFFGAAPDGNYFGDLDSSVYGMMYPGIAVWLGIFLMNGFRRMEAVQRHRIAALAATAGLGMGLAWGLPGLSWIHGLPLFNTMLRCHHLVFPAFALPLLGATGLSPLTERTVSRRLIIRAGLLSALAAGFVLVQYRFHGGVIAALGMRPFVATQMAVAGTLALVALGLVVVHAVLPRPRLLLGALTVILAVDLLYAARGINPTIPPGQLYPPTELTDYLRSIQPPPRVNTASANIPAGFNIPYGIEQWGAYDGLYPERMMTFQRTLGQDIWNTMEPVCGIEYYLNDPRGAPKFPLEDTTRFERVATLDGIEVYRNKRAFPRAFLVGGLEVMDDREALFARMKERAYDPAKVVVARPGPVLHEVPRALRNPPEGSPGTARVIERTPTRVLVEADADREAVLVLSDAWYPGWRATIDGRPAGIFPAYDVFRGLVLPPGPHTVEYRFRPASVWWGAWISGLSLLLLPATVVVIQKWGGLVMKVSTPHNGEPRPTP